MQYIHNADETTLCMLHSLQAACTRPQSEYPLGHFALWFVAEKGSANPFSRHFIRWILIWLLLTGSSPEQRVVAKARLKSHSLLHVRVDILVHKVKWCTFVVQSGNNMHCIAFEVMKGTNCPSRSLPSYNQWWICRPSDIFLHISLEPAFVTLLACTGGLPSTWYSVGQSH